jgi:hypothetical protein
MGDKIRSLLTGGEIDAEPRRRRWRLEDFIRGKSANKSPVVETFIKELLEFAGKVQKLEQSIAAEREAERAAAREAARTAVAVEMQFDRARLERQLAELREAHSAAERALAEGRATQPRVEAEIEEERVKAPIEAKASRPEAENLTLTMDVSVLERDWNNAIKRIRVTAKGNPTLEPMDAEVKAMEIKVLERDWNNAIKRIRVTPRGTTWTS